MTVTELEQAETTFTAHDRCDACGAQATHRRHFVTGELLFCNHHERKHRDAIAKQALA